MTRTRHLLAASASIALIALGVGCGDEESAQQKTTTTTFKKLNPPTTAPPATTKPTKKPTKTSADPDPATPVDGPVTGKTTDDGKSLFASTCGGCHTLAAAGTSGRVGPNLDDLRPAVDRVLAAIKAGPGVMPEELYDGADARAVAEFVAGSAGG